MSRILIFGETNLEFKERLIKLSLHEEDVQLVEESGIKTWISTKGDTKFYEINDNVERFPYISEINICWFMLSKESQITEAFGTYSRLILRKKNIAFIVTNQEIKDIVKNTFGSEKKIFEIKYDEESLTFSDPCLIDSVQELQLASNIKETSSIQEISCEENCSQLEIDSYTQFLRKISKIIDSNKANKVELFVIGFKESLNAKRSFVNGLVKQINPISNNDINIYPIIDKKLILFDLLRELDADGSRYSNYIPSHLFNNEDISTIIKDFIHLRTRNAIPIITFFPDNEKSFNYIIDNCQFNLPKIIISTKSYERENIISSKNVLDETLSESMEKYNLNTSFVNFPMSINENQQLYINLENYMELITNIISNLSINIKFSILITEKSDERTSIINAIMHTVWTPDCNTNVKEFKNCGFKFITRVDTPVTLIEYCKDLDSITNNIQSFHEQFSEISRQYNCLSCWNIVERPSKLHKAFLKELKEMYNISSTLIITNQYYFFNLREEENRNPSKYNADNIVVIPLMSYEYNVEDKLIDLMTGTGNMVHHPYKLSIEMLIKSRERAIKESIVSKYEEFELNKTENISNELGVKNFNIILIGQSGAGKSTLINALLRKDEAAIDHVKPCTKGFDEYAIPKSGIKLIDSEGFELNNFEDTKSKIINEIEFRSTSDSSTIIHMIWYCVKSQGHRFVKAEHQIIEELRTMGIPIIIIVTNSWNEERLDEAIKKDSGNEYPLYQDLLNTEDKDEILKKRIIITNVLAKRAEYNENRMIHYVAPYGIPGLIDLLRFYLPEEKSLWQHK